MCIIKARIDVPSVYYITHETARYLKEQNVSECLEMI